MAPLIGEYLVLAVVLFVAALLTSLALAVAIIIRLPADYVLNLDARSRQVKEHGIVFGMRVILKNLLGAIIIVIGVILSIPGLPGQGLLTVLAGALMLDFPGKRKLLCKILNRPRLLRAVNRLRMRFLRPPLVLN